MLFIEKWTATRMLVSSQANAIKTTHSTHTHTHMHACNTHTHTHTHTTTTTNTIKNIQANHAVNWVWFGNNAYSRLITHMQIGYSAICSGFWSGFNIKIERRHDKTNKMICAPREDSDQPGHQPSLISVCAVRLKQNWVLSYPLSSQRRLIRLGGCSGWSESSLGTKVILLVLSWDGSKCFFIKSKYAAHIHFITFVTFRIEPNMKLFSHANNIVLV